MKTIKLNIGEWKYDPDKQLGSKGGFGIVFAGTGQGHNNLAIKKLNIEAKEAAHRELKIAKDLADRKLSHVIPVLDSGQDADSDFYFVVMAQAKKSLQDELDSGKIFDDIKAANVLLQIAEGLSEVTDIVHRDLKPANVLFHEGKWKITDFGIARFVEESTSLQTLKGCLTPPYAAPEQWRLEHSTAATDIYALGCIGYALLTGQPPFKGPNTESFKVQHLSEAPPRIDGHEPRLSTLLTMMLRKAPEARPSRNRVKHILQGMVKKENAPLATHGLEALAQAGVDIATQEAEQEAKLDTAKAREEKRKHLAKEAFKVLKAVIDKMFDHILESAPAAKCPNKLSIPFPGQIGQIFEHKGIINLGRAQLMVWCLYQNERMIPDDAFPQSGWDVVLGSVIHVMQVRPKYIWSASLWYSKLTSDDDNYRWREVSYFVSPLVPKDQLGIKFEPFALKNLSDADEAASPGMGVYEIAFGPKPIDDEDFDEFFNRWAKLLAKAAKGQLEHPRVLPLRLDEY